MGDLGYVPAERPRAVPIEDRELGKEMSFQTISLLPNWMELGVLLAILFRLSYTFDLIAKHSARA